MKVVTNQQMKEIDRKAIEEYGISGLTLMENAGLRIFQSLKNIYPDLRLKKIAIFAGSGNNGGDGFVVARHLYNYGAKVKVFLLAPFNKIKGEAGENLNTINKMGVELIETEITKLEEIQRTIQNSDLIIDAILGTGLQGKVTGLKAKIIDLTNIANKEVVAIDVPSGLDTDTGKIEGPCIKATHTITLALPKIGLLIFPGASYAGKVTVEDISIPSYLLKNNKIKTNMVTKEIVKSLLPFRATYSHKGSFGKVLILAGSIGMTGAAYLASEAAMRSGAGIVVLGIPRSLNPIMEVKLTEVMTLPLAETEKQSLGEEAEETILKLMENYSVLGIGPGISRQAETQRLVRKIIEKSNIPLVIDADAIYALSEDSTILKKTKTPLVITPHPGEVAKLTNKDIDYILNNQLDITREIAQKFGIVVVLKGARTIIANKEGEAYINVGDNSGMATGGSGDVLTGIICSLIAQGADNFSAAITGVYIHSLAGDLARDIKGERGMIAGDILSQIPRAFLNIEGTVISNE
ncbi:MAG TPA: bifunctional ADP-dependent NAD(P)H-hydrate dehydratase/NAD(P)H-hydrate epimerase [Candidatus Atribacteria bacterium]|nr:bifunctional ADP-dependent NAD(P)H-hydrate dehydratase/NAD(P)H-hydrate epimerase [Candidatus Atribacteria bacterium]